MSHFPAFLPCLPVRLPHQSFRSDSLCSSVPYYRQRSTPRLTLADPTSSPAASPASTTTDLDVLVVGSGISGSSLAFQIHQSSPDVSLMLTEARDVVGGNVISRKKDGYVWEEGPNTFQPAPHIMRLIVDLGLKDDLVLADSTLPRFVYWDKKLFALPLGVNDLLGFRLLSLWGMVRAGLGALGIVGWKQAKEESVKQFIERHLGKEVFERMIDPFVSGVYAGDPEKLSMSDAFKKIANLTRLGGTEGILEGALIRIGEKKRENKGLDPDLPKWKGGALGSFRDGLGMLPNKVSEVLGDRVRLGWKLVALTKEDDGRYRAEYETSEGTRVIRARAVALTAPARAAADILEGLVDGVEAVRDIVYPTVWSVTLAYPKSAFKEPLRGFGNLIPRTMGIRTLGTIWSSCLFERRAPEGMELLLSYIGGARDDAIKGLSEEEVVKVVDGDIKTILMKEGSDVEPVVVGARRWERAIPQYNIGYAAIMQKVEKGLESCEGLFLGGNYTSGVAFGDCVQWGVDTAGKVGEFVKQQREAEAKQ